MLLTIGMIMKNEERFLRDCLTAIKPILDNVDSELIIHDTGSTDNSIAIAKEFTDNVFEIEWRDDFGWARQQGFELAKGEWFLQLDADEIFEDVREIIDFFNSDEYKNYGMANVYYKNALGTSFSNKNYGNEIISTRRLFKIIKGMNWENKVHETLTPCEEPTKILNSMFIHYGNLSDVVDEKNKKEVYMKLLTEEVNENSNNYKTIYFLAAYHTDSKISRKYAERGIILAKKTELDKKFNNTLALYPAFVALLAEIYLSTYEYTKIIDCIAEYFDSVPKHKLISNAYSLKFTQSLAFEKESRFIEANEAALSAYAFKKSADNNEMPPDIGYTPLKPMKENEFINQILKTFVLANLLDEAVEWLDNLLATSTALISKYECYFSLINAVIDHNPQFMGKLYFNFADKHGKKELDAIATIIELVLSKKESSVKFIVAKNIIEYKNNYSDIYIYMQKIRLQLENSQNEIFDFLEFFVKQDELPILYADVLSAAAGNSDYFIKLAQKLNIPNLIEVFDAKVKPVDFMKTTINALIAHIDNTAEDENQIILFEMLANTYHQYCKIIYQTDIYCENNINLLPTEHIAAFYLGTAYEYKQEKKTADFAKYLRLALKFAPQYKQYIQKVTSDLLETHVEQPMQAQQQLKQETDRLKAIIYEMLNTGNLPQAQQIFETYAQINPADFDIPAMRKALFN
ncbi:MAG: glycosyltransferase family 2 protein [Firmicutes bacterium]|nr:glycosyltransferase family 2 protein [Bacillota bacterium]